VAGAGRGQAYFIADDERMPVKVRDYFILIALIFLTRNVICFVNLNGLCHQFSALI